MAYTFFADSVEAMEDMENLRTRGETTMVQGWDAQV